MFQRIAIVNRGEAAMRLIHAVRDLNAQAGPGGHRIETVALHTEADRSAMFVREADAAYDLGPASLRPYLDHAVLERALLETGADAAWVGWGFVAEDPTFAELCERIGVTFIGPSPEAMRRLGDKIGSKLIAEEVGVPVAPWSRGGVDTLDDAIAAAARIGYPLMLKATAGGGGRGIRKVTTDAELADAYERTRDEAQRAFGSGVVFLEKLVTGARHVEVQVIADGQGSAWAIGVRDCSVQRRNQKVIEESASPVLDVAQVGELKASAERLAIAVGYAGAGTVEFLYHPRDRFFAFLEVNTRLQVEHPITEVVTGTDLVRLQIHVASGGQLTGHRPDEVGHAVEARLNAEDPDRDFAPAPGRIVHLELPAGPGIRVDTGVAEGDSIPADFDSMIAKIIAHGRDRDEALARLRRAMRETTVVIEGGATNKSFILDLLDQPEVVDGSADTGWIDRVRGEGRLVASEHSGVALVVAGIEAYEEAEAVERTRLLETARGGRPQVQHDVGRAVDLKLRGTAYKVTVYRTGPARFRVSVAEPTGRWSRSRPTSSGSRHFASRVSVGGRNHRLVTASHGPVQLVEVDGVTHRVSRDEGGVLRSPAPALVVATPLAVGDEVAAGAPVLVLESMKMETVLPAPFAARLKELLVATGSQVETGAALARLEPTGGAAEAEAEAATDAPDLDLPADVVTGDVGRACRARARADLAAMLLGYDLDPGHETRTLAGYLAARDELAATGRSPVADEMDLLTVFADFAELSRNRPVGEEAHVENRVHSPREHFHTYLQTLDPERGGLPADFVGRLERVLGHYGVTGVERSEALEDAVFRVFLAQQRSAPEVSMATSILQRWLVEPAPAAGDEAAARELLDRLVSATQLRFPIVGDLARSVRFRWFDQPLVDADRASVLGSVGDELEQIDALPEGDERSARASTPWPPSPSASCASSAPGCAEGVPDREPMLAVLIKRHYREYDLRDLRETTVDGRAVATADYHLDGRDSHLVSTAATIDELADGTDAVPACSPTSSPTGRPTTRPSSTSTCTGPTSRSTRRRPPPPSPRGWPGCRSPPRCAGSPWASCPTTSARSATSPSARSPTGRWQEDRPVRDVHPMVGRRLNLWRLRDFELTRLEAPEDVLLLHAVAAGNPQDQRLVALAQVRQLVVVRDETGKVTALPHIERALANCLEAIRRARATLGAGARLDTNHVWLHIWPPVEADLDQLTALQGKVAPMTAGAGIEEVRIEGAIAGENGHTVPICARFSYQPGSGVTFTVDTPPTTRVAPLDGYAEKVVRARRRGLVYPYELVAMVAGSGGSVQELDLDDSGRLVPVSRPYGENTAGLICGLVTTPTPLHPEGVSRVLLCGDPLRALGAVAEPECARVIAALDLAEERGLPVEWFALSAGARISMDSGTENMDWVAKALKRIIEFTQAGHEINVVVAGINVGAQPYWNAEATMLMHTKGILVMTPDSAMVLTGKQSLDFSGGVSAEDNFGIGGYDRVMGPNGQAQYWAKDLVDAYGILLAHYENTWVAPGEPGPRRAPTNDPHDRDVTPLPARAGGQRLHHGRRHLLAGDQPRPQEGLRHPHRDAGGRRPGPRHPRALGRHGRRRDRGRSRRPHRRDPGVPVGHRVQDGPEARGAPDRRPGRLHRGHALPAVVEEGGPGDQRRERQPAARRARQPVGLRRLTRLDARAAARVRRRDRPGGRQLRRADRLRGGLALPRWCVRGVLQGAQPADDGARGRGLVRLGHRRGARGGGRVRP